MFSQPLLYIFAAQVHNPALFTVNKWVDKIQTPSPHLNSISSQRTIQFNSEKGWSCQFIYCAAGTLPEGESIER